MRVIGLTGGVGAGKSQVLEFLAEEYHAEVIIADLVAHQLMEPGEPGYLLVVEALGNDILSSDGTIDRQALGTLMFADKDVLETVNGLIHPAVWNEIKKRISSSKKSLVIVEAALLQKEKDDIYDELWYLYTSRENRIRRLEEGRGYSGEKSLSIMKNQPDEETFRMHCQRVIDNNGSMEETKQQIRAILGD